MKKFKKIVVGMATAIAIFLGITIMTTQPAAAVVGRVYIYNNTNNPVRIYCSYGDSSYKLLYKGQSSQMVGKCTAKTNDTDQMMAPTTLCINYKGPSVTDGYYKLGSWEKVKVHDLANIQIYDYGSKCSSKPYYRHR